ncbi:MAG: PRC-barrel domain-containing protein [Cyanobacteria bacterium Co-bin13]|nr:PRC-barrel domain-containing protein [Cyanobacteria bacterium Co-bin13]
MAATPDTLQQGELLHRLVIDINTTEVVGRVSEVLVDAQAHQVEGIVCRGGLMGRERRTFSWVQIESIGKDSVVVRPITDHAPHRLDQTQPMTGQEVWSDAGDRVGRLVDFRLNSRTGLILAYGFAPEGLRGLSEDVYALAPEAVISAGRKRIMVRDSAVQAPAVFGPGWAQKAADAAAALKEDYAHTRERLGPTPQSSQEIADQLQERVQQLSDTAKGQWGQVFGQVKQRTRKLRSQLRETVSDMTANLPAGQPLDQDKQSLTIDVDSIEVWPDEDLPPSSPPDHPSSLS